MKIGNLRWLGATLLLAASLGDAATAREVLLGVNTHVINYPAAQSGLLDLAHQLGVDAVRADTGWKFVETTKGVYRIPPAWDQFVDRARRRGIEPLLILDYGNRFYDDGHLPRSQEAIAGFVRFATFVVRHFAGRVRYYEVWNEWNTGTGGYYPGGSAEDYARLFDATYAAIKRVDPGAQVLAAAGYGNWYADIAKFGVAARADGVAIHPYVTQEPGDRAAGGSNGAERSVQKVIDAESIMRRSSGGKEIPIYVTEIGWSTSTGRNGYPEADAGAIAERSLLMFAALPYVRGIWWYDLIDDGPNPAHVEERYGLLRRNYSFKPAADAFRSLASLVTHGDLTWDPQSNLAAGRVVIDRRSAGSRSVIAWQVPTASTDERVPTPAYALSCGPQLKITPFGPGAPAADLALRPVPQVFAYQTNRCSHRPLLERR